MGALTAIQALAAAAAIVWALHTYTHLFRTDKDQA